MSIWWLLLLIVPMSFIIGFIVGVILFQCVIAKTFMDVWK
jgi:uncharacterized protein YneF (UPF0154 family)